MDLHLFTAVGIELEHMLVDPVSLDVAPVADRVLTAANGGLLTGDVDRGPFGWSNELVSHVIELKTNGPCLLPPPAEDPAAAKATSPWVDLNAGFAHETRTADGLARAYGPARLLGTAMHPWMDPSRERVLWPHDYGEVYAAFDRIFGSQGHGWSNLQSMHLNLPFSGDEEFAALHAAIRLVLPLLPALAASSPIVEQRVAHQLDHRLEVYRGNARRIPEVAGDVIPEPVFSEVAYRERIFRPLMAAIGPHDPEGIFEAEWLNARGAIARFSRGSIEIRVIDVQECVAMDLAIAELVVETLRGLVEERWSSRADQQAVATAPLAATFSAAVREGDNATLADPSYLRLFGIGLAADAKAIGAGPAWRSLAERVLSPEQPCWPRLQLLFEQGPLARRILRALGSPAPGARVPLEQLRGLYRQLADCLQDNRPFSCELERSA